MKKFLFLLLLCFSAVCAEAQLATGGVYRLTDVTIGKNTTSDYVKMYISDNHEVIIYTDVTQHYHVYKTHTFSDGLFKMYATDIKGNAVDLSFKFQGSNLYLLVYGRNNVCNNYLVTSVKSDSSF